MVKTMTILLMLLYLVITIGVVQDAAAQDSVELRYGVSRGGAVYRYIDFNHVFHNKVTLDAYYIGVPGQNEFYLGVGYQVQATKSLTVTPLLYGVIGKEGAELGVAMGASVNGSVKGLILSGYVCHFEQWTDQSSDPRFSTALI